MAKIRHILGISGGKDSAALSIYLKQKYPQMKIEYYNSDTGCELAETEILIDRLGAYLGNIKRLRAAEGSPEPTPFEHFLKSMGGFLPSPQQRWCTKKMKLEEFERYVGKDDAVSYVGIRGDEDRDCGSEEVDGFGRGRWATTRGGEGKAGKEDKITESLTRVPRKRAPG